jgi:hypothetical protein
MGPSDAPVDPCADAKPTGRLARDAVKEVQRQLQAMHHVVRADLERIDSANAFWCQSWEFHLLKAAGNEWANRDLLRVWRLVGLVSVLSVSALTSVGASASGPWKSWLGWVAAVVGVVAAISNGVVALQRFGDRWLLNHRLRMELLEAGWTYTNRPAPRTEADWQAFREQTATALADFDLKYQSQLIIQNGASTGTGGNGNQP